jgi:hypothetical protein
VSVTIFFEGGGDREATQSKCREGLSKYCAKLKPPNSRLRIVAGGGREQTFDKFKRAAQNSRAGEVSVLLVDAEGPVTAASPVAHLCASDRWDFAESQNYEVFLMVQTMESWFLADRDALAAYYDGGFLPRSLPGSDTDIESIRKEDVESGLKKATRKTERKGEYQKVNHGASLLALIDPAKVGRASPHAANFHQFLRGI